MAMRPPFDAPALEETALSYAGRYATTRARLAAYLHRKLRARGWAGEGEPPVEATVEKLAALGYVDDRAFAAARAASLGRRGYGALRISDALRVAGVAGEQAAPVLEQARGEAWGAALRFAERRRIGPFADVEPDRAGREKAIAALMRAGHPYEIARRIVSARPGEIPDVDIL